MQGPYSDTKLLFCASYIPKEMFKIKFFMALNIVWLFYITFDMFIKVLFLYS